MELEVEKKAEPYVQCNRQHALPGFVSESYRQVRLLAQLFVMPLPVTNIGLVYVSFEYKTLNSRL